MVATAAEQAALLPPFSPAHVQFHGPEPETFAEVPGLQSPVEFTADADAKYCPAAGPHTASTGGGPPHNVAEHEAVEPPFAPAQVQLHGPVPETVEAAPTLQRSPPDGAAVKSCPFAEPQAPLTLSGAEHDALVPPPDPLQLHDHGPDPEIVVAVPAEQRFDDGADVTPTPFADPQTPLTAGHRSAATGA